MKNKIFEFIRGNPKSPTGNLLLFAFTKGFTPLTPSSDEVNNEIIICNVMVSFLEQGKGQYPVIAFPPTTLPKINDIRLLLKLNQNYDVFQLQNFILPPEQDVKAYLRFRIRQFNQAVSEYINMCRDYIETTASSVEFISTSSTSLNDIMETNEFLSALSLEYTPTFEEGFFHPEILQKNQFSPSDSRLEEIRCLKYLEKCVALHKKEANNYSYLYLQKIISFIEIKYQNYDVKNLARAIELERLQYFPQKPSLNSKMVSSLKLKMHQNEMEKNELHSEKFPTRKKQKNLYTNNLTEKFAFVPGVKYSSLSGLYLLKFRAIQAENYEQAARIQLRIQKIEEKVILKEH